MYDAIATAVLVCTSRPFKYAHNADQRGETSGGVSRFECLPHEAPPGSLSSLVPPVHRSSGPLLIQPPILRLIAGFVAPCFELWCKSAAFLPPYYHTPSQVRQLPSLGQSRHPKSCRCAVSTLTPRSEVGRPPEGLQWFSLGTKPTPETFFTNTLNISL